MSDKAKLVARVGVWLTVFLILVFGGIKTDWPWHSLWTDPAAIRWTEVLKVMAVMGIAGL